MSALAYDRLVPSAGVWSYDRLVDVGGGAPVITALGTLRDGATLSFTGTSFSASGNTAFLSQDDKVVQLPLSAEGTTSLTASAIDTSGLYLLRPVSIYVLNNSGVQSNAVVVASILPKASESVSIVSQEFLGDATTRLEASPDFALGDEVRVKSVVGGTISDVAIDQQATASVASAVTSFQYAPFDGSILGDYATVNWASPVATALVPNLVGSTQADAIAAIIAAGFVPTIIDRVESATYDAGDVAAQFPASGQALVLGGVVEITISLGILHVLVPPLIGLLQDEAEAARAAAGLTGSTFRVVDGLNSGRVLNQSVNAGEVVFIGDAVDIAVSSSLVPDVVGQGFSFAVGIIQAAGLTFDEDHSTFETSLTIPVDHVIRQTPTADTIAAPGALVSLVVSSGGGTAVRVRATDEGFFDGFQRHTGEVMNLYFPQEYSPYWMEFVDTPPDEWLPLLEVYDPVVDRARLRPQPEAQNVPEPFRSLLFH